MSRLTSSFFKGVGTGAALGVIAVATATSMKCNHKATKKKLSGAVKTASDFMENISYMLK